MIVWPEFLFLLHRNEGTSRLYCCENILSEQTHEVAGCVWVNAQRRGDDVSRSVSPVLVVVLGSIQDRMSYCGLGMYHLPCTNRTKRHLSITPQCQTCHGSSSPPQVTLHLSSSNHISSRHTGHIHEVNWAASLQTWLQSN